MFHKHWKVGWKVYVVYTGVAARGKQGEWQPYMKAGTRQIWDGQVLGLWPKPGRVILCMCASGSTFYKEGRNPVRDR